MNTTQSDFRAALFDPDLAAPPSLADGEHRAAGKRFDVYRNNVIVSLKQALADSFPVVEKLIGVQNFASLAGLYVRANPPSDPRMMLYGDEFPGFLETFEPLKHIGYLPDVARLELAMRRSYHAADATAIDPAIFASLPPEQLVQTQARFAPAMHIVRSPWPILDIWHFNMTEAAPQPRAEAQDVLIARPEFDPNLHLLGPGAYDVLTLLHTGKPLGTSLESIEETAPDFDFSALLGTLLQSGALISLTTID